MSEMSTESDTPNAVIILGLLTPVSGQLLIDGLNVHESKETLTIWRSLIAHVPQQVYLIDSSFASNIASLSTSSRENIWGLLPRSPSTNIP